MAMEDGREREKKAKSEIRYRKNRAFRAPSLPRAQLPLSLSHSTLRLSVRCHLIPPRARLSFFPLVISFLSVLQQPHPILVFKTPRAENERPSDASARALASSSISPLFLPYSSRFSFCQESERDFFAPPRGSRAV